MRASLFLFISAAIITSGNGRAAIFQCSRFCKEDWNKFGYEIGNSYQYIYNGNIITTINSTEQNTESGFSIESQVKINPLSTCDYVMELSNIKFEEVYTSKNTKTRIIPDNFPHLDKLLTKHILYFSFQNGRIDTICPEEEEDQNILNIKKSILSAFQNSMPSFEKDAIVYENDVSGNCETQYQVEKHASNLIIKKVKNLKACSHRLSRSMSWLSVPHSKSSSKGFHSILRSKQTCTQSYNDEYILGNSICFESHLFQPFSNGNHGAVTHITQTLKYVSTTKAKDNLPLPKQFFYDNLLSDYKDSNKIEKNRLYNIIKLLKELESKTTNGVEPSVPVIFSQLVHKLKSVDSHTLTNTFQIVKTNPKQKKFLLDAMPLITSVEAIETMKKLFEDHEVSDADMNSWLGSLVFFTNISLPVINSVKPLMLSNSMIKQKAVLIGSTLVYMYCKENLRCFQDYVIKEVVKIVNEPLSNNCVPISPGHYNSILLSLKAIGNIGSTSSLWYLRRCYTNKDSPLELRLAAIAAHRRINCVENDNLEQFQDYFANIHEKTEIRIASYLACMQCASYATFARIKDVLRTEETNQVGSFVWTHLTNLQETSSSWKQNLKSLVENEFLRNKFSTDMRKYSRNYEVSTNLEFLKAGVTMESNVIFTSESYLPKSVMLNFTLDLFGEAINVFELGGRIEGFEQVVENIFGPKGYFPEQSVQNALKSVHNKENGSKDKIQELRDSFASQATHKEPNGQLYAKIFGNEVSYVRFKDTKGLLGEAINEGIILEALMKIFRQQALDYTKSFVFIESSYKIPTLLGFPLTLDMNGSATVGLTIKSKIDLKDLWAHKIAIEGKFYPSLAVEVIGTLTVDSFISKAGLKSVNKLNSNTYLDGHAFIDKGKLIDLKLNVPKRQMDIINMESQVYVILGKSSYNIDDSTNNVENWKGCTPRLINTVSGLEFCYLVQYLNTSRLPNAPYFPLTGNFRFSVGAKKIDTFDSYQLRLETHKVMKNYKPIYSMSFYLDTPNSRIDRKIKTFYLLDCDHLSLNATLVSPFVNVDVKSKIGNDSDNLEFIFQTKLNNNNILSLNMSLKSSRIEDTWRYEPLAEIEYKSKIIAALSGNINYLQGTKYSADLQLSGISNDPIRFSGDLHVEYERLSLSSTINSTSVSGNAQAIIIKKPETIFIISTLIYDYNQYKNQTLDFEFNHQMLMKSSVFEENLYVSINSTQKPMYNTLLSLNVHRDKLYFESKGDLLLFNTTWQTHQLFKFEKSNYINEVILKWSFECEKKDIEYNIALVYIKSDTIFKMHGLLQLTKIKRFEALIDYDIILDKNRTLSLLLYYPKHAWLVNGTFKQERQKQFNVLIESFYEIEDEKRCMLILSGKYFNSTVGNYQNHTITGSIEIPETKGQFATPWIIHSTLQIAPDLFLSTFQMRTTADFYILHMSWSPLTLSGLLQIDDKQLFTVNGIILDNELNFSAGLNIYQHFEINTKLLMPYQKLDFQLFWDKDKDPNQKISVILNREVSKGLYLVVLEYPNQKVNTSFVLLPTQVTINVTWGIDLSQQIYLKAGNKVYDIGAIWFANLETPFRYLENQQFKMSYYMLPQNAELKIDLFWRDQNINFIASGSKTVNHLSGYVLLNTTIPEICKLRAAVSHTRNITNTMLKIKNDATFVFNDHQITGQCLWKSTGANISSSFEIVSSSDSIAPIMGNLIINNNQSANLLSSFVVWRNKTLSIDYKFQESQSYIRIKTPFKGLEVTELDYTLIGETDKLEFELKVNILKQFNYGLISWNNKEQVNVIRCELISPPLGAYKIIFKHGTTLGQLNEVLIVTQSYSEILVVRLRGNLIPILKMDINATVRFLECQSSITIANTPNPVASLVAIRWNKNFIIGDLKMVIEDNSISSFYWDISSSALLENITCMYYRTVDGYTFELMLPKGYKMSNVLTLKNSYKSIQNALNVSTPSRSGFILYNHNLSPDNYNLKHEIIFKMNNNESKFILSYNINKDKHFLEEAYVQFSTPWQSTLVLDYSMPKDNEYSWKPMLNIRCENETIIKLESSLQLNPKNYLASLKLESQYLIPFDIVGVYDFTERIKDLKINIKYFNQENIEVLSKLCLEEYEGIFTLNITKNSKVLTTFLNYTLNTPLKTAVLDVELPGTVDKFKIESKYELDGYGYKSSSFVTSSILEWEKASLIVSLGANEDESHFVFKKNQKHLRGSYMAKKLISNDTVNIEGKILLISHFDAIQNISLDVKYKSCKHQEASVNLILPHYKGSFNGEYELTNQSTETVRCISLNGKLGLTFNIFENGEWVKKLDINGNTQVNTELKTSNGKLKSLLITNIPYFEKIDLNANYEVYKKGYKIETDLVYNDDNYSFEHTFHPSLNEIDFYGRLSTPPALYGTLIGKLHMSTHKNLLSTELLVYKKFLIYNATLTTYYDAFLSTDTKIAVITPFCEHEATITTSFTLKKSHVKVYAIINKQINQFELLLKTKNYKKVELQVQADLKSLNISPYNIKAKYEIFLINKSFKFIFNNKKRGDIELYFNTDKFYLKINTNSKQNYILFKGIHRIKCIDDLLFSYSLSVIDYKIKFNLTHELNGTRKINFNAFSNFKGWENINISSIIKTSELFIFADYKTHELEMTIDKNALFNNKELLSFQFNKIPILLIWSGTNYTYLTSITQWQNCKVLLSYPTEPKKYTFEVLQDGIQSSFLSIEDIHLGDFIEMRIKLKNFLFLKHSDLNAYLYANKLNLNEFRFSLDKHLMNVLKLSYSFREEKQTYSALFDLNSNLPILESLSVSFAFNPKFLFKCEILKTSYQNTAFYNILIELPFDSNQCLLDLNFPWDNKQIGFFLELQAFRVYFQLKTPFIEWDEVVLVANYVKNADLANGSFRIEKNKDFLMTNWVFGYDRHNSFVKLDIKNRALTELVNKIIINGRYDLEKQLLLFNCDFDGFGNQIVLNYNLNLEEAHALSRITIPALFITNMIVNVSSKYVSNLNTVIKLDEFQYLNLDATYGLDTKSIFIDIFENKCRYNLTFKYDFVHKANLVAAINSKTYDYILDTNVYLELDLITPSGKINGNLIRGDDNKELSNSSYGLSWIISNNNALIKFKKNYDITSLNYTHTYENGILKSELLISCNNKHFKIILDIISNLDIASGKLVLSTPLPELELIELETSLKRFESATKFQTSLSLPQNKNLLLDVGLCEKNNEKVLELILTSSYTESLKANLNYTLNSDQLILNFACSIGKVEIGINGIIIPQEYLSLNFRSPFSGYTNLNLTCVLDLQTKKSDIYFINEDSMTELKGEIKMENNKIYKINFVGNNYNIQLAKVFVQIDSINMKGKAEIFWQDEDFNVDYCYDPKNLLLEIRTPFSIAKSVKLKGEYLDEVYSHSLKGNGVWNKLTVTFNGHVFVRYNNFTILSSIDIGDNYKGVFNYVDYKNNNKRDIKLKAYFPNKDSEVTFNTDLDFENEIKSKVILSTPFELIKLISAESLINNRSLEIFLQFDLVQQKLYAELQTSFNTFFDLNFNISIPHYSQILIKCAIDVYKKGVLNISHLSDSEINNMCMNYNINKSKLKTQIIIDSNRGNLNNSLEIFFKNDYEDKKYGFVLNTNKFLYTSNNSWDQTDLELIISEFSLNLIANSKYNKIKNEIIGRLFLNNYIIDVNIINNQSHIFITSSLDYGDKRLNNIYTIVNILHGEYFVENNINNNINNSISYFNKNKVLKINISSNELFKSNIYISRNSNIIKAYLQNIIDLNFHNDPTFLSLNLTLINKHQFTTNFQTGNLTLSVKSSSYKPENFSLKIACLSDVTCKQIGFDYLELEKSVINSILNLSFTNERNRLTLDTLYYGKPLINISLAFQIGNITQGLAILSLPHEKHRAYFLFSQTDPYLTGFTVNSSLLPYGGVTFETKISINSYFNFIFIGSGGSDELDKGFITIESHKEYILFEAKKENKTISIKYEAPSISWLKLVDLQTKLNINNKSLDFMGNLKIESDITKTILLNTKFQVLKKGLDFKIDFLIPFENIRQFKTELNVPYHFSTNFKPKILVLFKNHTYLAFISYQNQKSDFLISGGYQCNSNILNATFHILRNPFTELSLKINLPYGKYKNHALSLKKPINSNPETEIACYIDTLNERIDITYIVVLKRDRQVLKAILNTSIESHEKYSLTFEYQLNRVLKALIYYPKLERECGFNFDLAYKNFEELRLTANAFFPTEIKGIKLVQFNINHKLQKDAKSYYLDFITRINNFNLSLDLYTVLNSSLIQFRLNSEVGENKFYTNAISEGSIANTCNSMFEIHTPLSIISNAKLYLSYSLNLSHGIHGGLIYNSKQYLKTSIVAKKDEIYLRSDNIWQSFLVEYRFHNTDHFHISGRICWNLRQENTSQFGGHFILGKNFSVGVILPTRIVEVDAKLFMDEHNEYYFGRISWYKGKEISTEISFRNSSSVETLYLRSAIVVILPFREFELINEIEKSSIIKSRFTLRWDKNGLCKAILQNIIHPDQYEFRLFIPVLSHEIILKLDASSLSKTPSHMKAQLEYSNDTRKHLDFEMYYDKHQNDIEFQADRKFILRHPYSRVDYTLHFSTSRTMEFTTSNVTLSYTNYVLNKKEEIKSAIKLGHKRFEVIGEIKTNKNYLGISCLSKTGASFQGFVIDVRINQKEPLTIEGIYNFKPTGSSLSISSSYGNSRKYEFYAGLPSKREVTVKLLRQIYDDETIDGLFTIRLNTSQILWIKLNWKDEIFSRYQNAILGEYDDIKYIIEETGYQIIDVIDDEVGQNFISDVIKLQNKTMCFINQEIALLRKDYKSFLSDINEGFKSNAFYYQDIKHKTKELCPTISAVKQTLLNPIFELLELLYKSITELVYDMVYSFENLYCTIQLNAGRIIKEVGNIKKLKARAKEIFNTSINEARRSLKQIDTLIMELIESMDEYITKFKKECEHFFEPYLKLLDDLVIYVEQRLTLLQMLILDMLDTIQHYILNLRESREVLKVYLLYINWLEEFHITDILEPIGDVIETILDTIIKDVKKVMDDYRPYIDAFFEAILGNYQDLKNLPPLTEVREKLNKFYQKTLLIWNYHKLSNAVKNIFHKIMSDFDDYLASFLKFDDEYNDFENVLGQSDYIFRPELGVIEITQPLPVDWEAFDEMPYFEQHPLYDKIRKRLESLVQIQRHHFNDIFNLVKSYIGESPEILLSPSTNNVGMIIGNSHYITFDKKYYTFSGECSYMLASDFITNTFSVMVNYELNQTDVKKKSITIVSNKNRFEIYPDFTIKLNNIETSLPIVVGSLIAIRNDFEVTIENSKGFKIICNLYYDYCSIELSGWLFGKIGGLLGTLDNEKLTDMSLPNGGITSNVLDFAQSWRVYDSNNCSDVNYANKITKSNLSPLTVTLFETLCQVFFINANSPIGDCFRSVDPKPFYSICVDNMKTAVSPNICSAVAAYKAQCEKRNIIIAMPEMCIYCKYGISSDEDIFDKNNPKSLDIVFIIEDVCFDNKYNFSSFPKEIDMSLNKREFYNNKFSVVGYDPTINNPFVLTTKSKVWNNADNMAIETKRFYSKKTVKKKISGINAVNFASNMEFRPGVSKMFIMMHCDNNTTQLDVNLNNLHNMLEEKDIKLHVLNVHNIINSHNEELLEFDNNQHILYVQQGFNLKNLNITITNTTVKEIIPNHIVDVYSVLALSTNGTVYILNNKLIKDGTPILSPWAEVISQSAKRSPCQRCKCMPIKNGPGKVQCLRCMSPIVKKLLNEYESNIMEFHSNQYNEEYL